MTTPDAPILDAYTQPDGMLVAWCEHCRRWHHHGRGAGHRAAHCWGNTPYRATGYSLRIVGPLTPAVQRHYGKAVRS